MPDTDGQKFVCGCPLSDTHFRCTLDSHALWSFSCCVLVHVRTAETKMASKTAHTTLATTFKSLHIPGRPLVIANVYDAASARAVASLGPSSVRAMATASWAVAAAAGVDDGVLDLQTNLAAVRSMARVAKDHDLPLTVDFQDGYGTQLEKGVEALLAYEGIVVGMNLEDYDRERVDFYSIDEAVDRIQTVLAVAKRAGINDFVVNARADPLLHGGTIAECADRGKAYLAAGATTVFVLGGTEGRKSLTKDEIRYLVSELGGMVNVGMKLGGGNLTAKEFADLGVARISMGPELHIAAMKALKEKAAKAVQY